MVTRQKRLKDGDGEIADVVPQVVQNACDEYMKTMRAKNKATEKMNAAKDNCIATMKENSCNRVRVDDGGKWLVLEEHDALKTEKIKTPADEASEE